MSFLYHDICFPHFWPVFTVADIVEIPARRNERLETSFGYVVSIFLPVVSTLPHMDDSVRQDLEPVVKYLLPDDVLLANGFDQLQQSTENSYSCEKLTIAGLIFLVSISTCT